MPSLIGSLEPFCGQPGPQLICTFDCSFPLGAETGFPEAAFFIFFTGLVGPEVWVPAFEASGELLPECTGFYLDGCFAACAAGEDFSPSCCVGFEALFVLKGKQLVSVSCFNLSTTGIAWSWRDEVLHSSYSEVYPCMVHPHDLPCHISYRFYDLCT